MAFQAGAERPASRFPRGVAFIVWLGGVKIVLPAADEASQRCRKRIEEIFRWVKTVSGLAKTKFRGLRRVALPAAFSHDEAGG